MKHIPTIEDFLNEENYPLSLDIVVKEWDAMYGEDFKKEYPAVAKDLGSAFDLKYLVKKWDLEYGEKFASEYKGLYDKLKKDYK